MKENLLEQIAQMTFSRDAILYLALTCVVLFVLPLFFAIAWKIRCGKKTSLKYLLAGAVGFVVSARILELGVHMIVLVMDNPISRFVNGHTVVYVFYGILMAGIFEEVGRWVILRFLSRKKPVGLKNAVMYGIGHAGIEVWVIVLMATVSSLTFALLFNSMAPEAAMAMLKIDETTVEAAYPVLIGAAGFGPMNLFLTVFERLLTMFIHIALTVIVYYGVKRNEKKYLLHAIGLHAIMDLMPAISQRMAMNTLVVEGWIVFWMIPIVLYARTLYKKDFAGQESGTRV